MPTEGFGARAELTPEAIRTVNKLSRANAMKPFRKEMMAAGRPLVQAARRAARQIPSTRSRKNTPGGSLRNAIAKAIRQKNKLSARKVSVLITEIPSGGKSNLARVLEGEIPWEHPTFGHDPKVTQVPHPFFYETLERMEPQTTEAIRKVLDVFEREL